MIQHSPPFPFNEHVLMLRLLDGYCLVAVIPSFCGCHQFWYYKGMKPPLYGWQESLFIWVGVFHIREVDICLSLFLTWGVLICYTPQVWSC